MLMRCFSNTKKELWILQRSFSELGSSLRALSHVFRVSCRTWSSEKVKDDFKHRCTIIPREALGTTVRICRKSLLNSTHLAPNKTFGSFIIALSVRSTASMQYLMHITISSQIIRSVSRIEAAKPESSDMLHTLSESQGIGILKTK